VGWFDDVVHAVTHPGSLVSGAEQGLGSLVDDGAHAVGGVLSSAGLSGAGQWLDRAGDDVANALGAQVPEEQLGQTTDPAELIHGDPGSLRQAASRLREFSAAFGETAGGLAGLDTGHWTGAAAEAFRAKYAPQPGRWRDASGGCADGAGALESYAGTVEWAQGQARQAIDVYESGQRATASAVASYDGQVAAYNQAAQAYDSALAAGRNPGVRPAEPGAFSDPGAALRQQAQQILTAARQERDRAASNAAGKVRAAADLAPAEPSFGQQLLDDLHDAGQADELAQGSFASGILTGASDIVKQARALDPLDPWNVTHLAEYTAGLSATAAGLVHDELHPLDAVQGLVGTGWGSDPAQAAGKLVPSLALAALTDGAGDAANAARPLDDMTLEGDPVDVASGDVVLAQADVRLAGTLPLVIRRVHRSSYRAGRWFGPSWASTLDQRLEVSEQAVCFAAADTVVLRYPHPGEDGEPVLPAAGARWPLARDGDGYKVTDPQAGTVWRFEPRSGYYLSADGLGELPLTSVTGRAGHQITISHDLEGAPVTLTHDGGYQVKVATADGRVTGLDLAGAGPGGGDVALARYRHDASGNLAEIINSAGQPQRLSYDQDGRLAGWEDRNGWSYRYAYDGDGRCVRGEGPDGTLSGTFCYDRDSLVTTHTDAAGAVSVYQLTGRYQVAAVTDPLGHITRSEHDQYGRLVSRTDPLDRTTSWSYDGAGNLTAITRPDGTQATAQYNDLNLPVEVTEPGGARWRQDYDAAGNLIRLTGPDGAATAYSYDERGHLTSVTGPDEAVSGVECDAAGLPVAVTGPDGAVTRYARDGFGRITAITQPGGSTTRLAWTTEGHLTSRVHPDGSAERYVYDGEGNLTAHLDPAAGMTKLEYTCFDQVAARTGPDGTRTDFSYDYALRLTEVRYAGLAWRYEYDAAGRLAAETDYNGATIRYAHDAAGQLTSQVNAAGQQVSYAYDLLGNLAERHADGAVTSFGYDLAGRLVHAANADAMIGIERDAAGRVTTETCDNRAVHSVYDRAGRRIRRVTPSGAETSWVYDRAGRPVTLVAGGQELRFGYDQDGQETTRDLPGGVTLTQQWDPVGRLATQVLTTEVSGPGIPPSGPGILPSGPATPLSGPGILPSGPATPQPGLAGAGRILQRRGYSYRADGCLAGIEDLLSGPRRFGLDPVGRVTGVTGPGWAEQYAYDPAGNITAAAWPAPPVPAADWAGPGTQGPREYAGTLITRAGDIRYRHDAQGRITTRQKTRLSRKPDTWHYTWDAGNRLTTVTTPDGATWRYLYDPLGRRSAKQRLNPRGGVAEQTYFTWDGPVLAEQATPAARPAWLAVPDGHLGPEPARVITWDYQPGTFTPLTQTERTSARHAPQQQIDERFYAIVTDLIGTPSELVGPDGDLAGYQQHTLWGTTLWKPGGADTPLRFPGQYADPETGLHYNHHRYYDPATARYLTPDPLGLAPAPNPHTYVPNPTTHTDPLGLMVGEGCVAVGNASTPGRARFITNRAGDTLDTSQVTIPEGKFGYLLKNPSKAGVFADSMGYDPQSLDPALRAHLRDNFGQATPSVPMTGGGTKFSVTGPMTGPSGATWNITTVWGIEPNGLIRLITGTPPS
jgi:RHS repeat-associated protein